MVREPTVDGVVGASPRSRLADVGPVSAVAVREQDVGGAEAQRRGPKRRGLGVGARLRRCRRSRGRGVAHDAGPHGIDSRFAGSLALDFFVVTFDKQSPAGLLRREDRNAAPARREHRSCGDVRVFGDCTAALMLVPGLPGKQHSAARQQGQPTPLKPIEQALVVLPPRTCDFILAYWLFWVIGAAASLVTGVLCCLCCRGGGGGPSVTPAAARPSASRAQMPAKKGMTSAKMSARTSGQVGQNYRDNYSI